MKVTVRVNFLFNWLPMFQPCDLLCFRLVCDGCTSSTKRFAWGLCAHMKSCSEVGSVHSVSVCSGVFVYWDLLFENCVCPISGPVSRPVLSLRRGSAEWPVFITRRKLREELWRLLMEHRHQGRYLPRYCRFSSIPSCFILLLPLSFSSLCLLTLPVQLIAPVPKALLAF